jgi:hypothetical protein
LGVTLALCVIHSGIFPRKRGTRSHNPVRANAFQIALDSSPGVSPYVAAPGLKTRRAVRKKAAAAV